MRKILKLMMLTLVASLACLALTSCKKVDKSKTIRFYHTMSDKLQGVLQVAIDDFEAKFPGWKIESVAVGGYDEVKAAIIADLQGQSQPDLAYCYSDHVAQYLETKKVVDMSKFINSTDTIDCKIVKTELDEDGNVKVDDDNQPITTITDGQEMVGYTAEQIADFVPGYYNEGFATNYADYDKFGYKSDAMFTLPFVKSTELLYYNKAVLDELKISVPTTWDELWAACEKINAKYPTATPLGYDSEANWFISACEQNGWGYTSASGNHYLFNNENTKAWLKQLNEYYLKGYITTQQEYGSYTSSLFVKGPADGGVVFCVGSSGGASHQDPKGKFEWGIAKVPGTKKADGTINSAVISQGPSLCMFYQDGMEEEKKDEKALMTWEFVKILLEPKFQASFSIASGYNPCRSGSYEIDAYVKHLESKEITAAAAKTATTMTNDFFTSPAFNGSAQARVLIGNALYYALTGEKSPEKALQDAYVNAGGKN